MQGKHLILAFFYPTYASYQVEALWNLLWYLSDFMKENVVGFFFFFFFVYKGYCAITLQTDTQLCE